MEINYLWASLQFIGDAATTAKAAAAIYFQIFSCCYFYYHFPGNSYSAFVSWPPHSVVFNFIFVKFTKQSTKSRLHIAIFA